MKYLLLFLICSFVSCSKKAEPNSTLHNNQSTIEQIESIDISVFGGDMGSSMFFCITNDSLIYHFSLAVDSTKNVDSKKINTIHKLEEIFTIDNLKEFSQLKNGPSYQPVDGTDTEIRIKTNKNEYAVMNADRNKLWDDLSLKLYKILNSEFRSK